MRRDIARILLIDDEPANLEFLRHVLEPENYGALFELTDADEALEKFPELQPDLILLDLMMPGVDGFEFLERLRGVVPDDVYLPVLIATADSSAETRRRALAAGARDFLTKPLSPADVRLRVRNLLETRFLHQQLRRYNTLLEERVSERTRELELARIEILDRLARAAEYRDDDTGQHTQRVGRLAARLRGILGGSSEEVELIRRAAPLHDVGKIGIPDSVLLKSGPLTPDERIVIQSHPTIGATLLSGSRSPLLGLAEEIALSHHERWDGLGYPRGLPGHEIPLAGRIVAVADVFDSLTHERPYKAAWSTKEALLEIEACAGTQFDPDVVEALLRIAPEAEMLSPRSPTNGRGSHHEPASPPRPRPSHPGSRAALDPEPEPLPEPVPPANGAADIETRIRQIEAQRKELNRQLRNLRRRARRAEAAKLAPAGD